MHTYASPASLCLVAGLYAALASGCGPAAETAAPSAAPAAPASESVLQAVRGQVRAYAAALLAQDAQRLQPLLSAELRSRIATRGPGAAPEEKLALFMARERAKLERALAAPSSLVASEVPSVDVLSVAVSGPDARLVAATVMLQGKLSPKPLYLVAEDQQYKLNIVRLQPSGDTDGDSNYRVHNDDLGVRNFECSSHGPYSIAPTPSERSVACEDSCHWLWFDGTTFWVEGVGADCDYNTWGVDMYIRGSVPVCNDPC